MRLERRLREDIDMRYLRMMYAYAILDRTVADGICELLLCKLYREVLYWTLEFIEVEQGKNTAMTELDSYCVFSFHMKDGEMAISET